MTTPISTTPVASPTQIANGRERTTNHNSANSEVSFSDTTSEAVSSVTVSSTSPFRSRRFNRQTRRQAWERHLNKKSPTKPATSRITTVPSIGSNPLPQPSGSGSPNQQQQQQQRQMRTKLESALLASKSGTDHRHRRQNQAAPTTPECSPGKSYDEKKSLTSGNITVTTMASSSDLHLAPPKGYSQLDDSASERGYVRNNSSNDQEKEIGEASSEAVEIQRIPQHLESLPINTALKPGEKYYRVVYKGVVALVARPESSAPRSGAYLSYGEVFASQTEHDVEELESLASSAAPVTGLANKLSAVRSPSNSESGGAVPDSPPRSVMSQGGGSVSSLDTLKTASSTGVARPVQVGNSYAPRAPVNVMKRAIRVDRVLTGGYAVDAAENAPTTAAMEVPQGVKTPKRSNAHYLPLVGVSPLPLARQQSDSTLDPESSAAIGGCDVATGKQNPLGYVFETKKNVTIVVPFEGSPQIEHGRFAYQIVSSTPLPILTGPCADAPKTRAMLLPGTVHEVCLKFIVGDGHMSFLRLSHRRGWIADRKISSSGKKVGAIPVVKEVTGQSSTMTDESTSISGLSLASSSVLSTPGSASRRRHRPPRRRRILDTSSDGLEIPMTTRQHKSRGGVDLFGTPSKNKFPPFGDSHHPSSNMPSPIPGRVGKVVSPSSNVSLLSDDEYPVDVPYIRKGPSSETTHDFKGGVEEVLHPLPPDFYLVRVNAPRGLKILDAPHFQVSNLIHGKQPSASNTPITSPGVRSDTSSQSIFLTMGSGTLTTASASKSQNAAVFDSVKRSRILPRGALFETCKRVEASSSFTEGEGLLKLSDGSGWAIVPKRKDLDYQYRNYLGGVSNVREGEATRAYEEVGNAYISRRGVSGSHDMGDTSMSQAATMWIRVISRNGVQVECAPHEVPSVVDDVVSPSSSAAASSTSGSGGANPTADSEVASSVGSGFLDAMFRTPRKKETEGRTGETHTMKGIEATSHLEPRVLLADTIPCGMCVEVERWDSQSKTADEVKIAQEYVRLCGGQGWIPRNVAGRPVAEQIAKPEIRYGSFWFRVQLQQGIKVRLGPSRRASSIKSEDDVYFRFECGEFLRASEVVTCFANGTPTECFAKLYRNRHVRHNDSAVGLSHRPLTNYTSPAEWVQVSAENRLFLEECKDEPRIKRHKDGWRYNVAVETGIAVRKGPSFACDTTGVRLLPGATILVNEQVIPPSESLIWLRLKDGQGWVHDVDQYGNRLMVAHSLRQRAKQSITERASRHDPSEKSEIAYNAIVARLFTQNNGMPLDNGKESHL